ncbi:hypothetical protein ACFW4X_25920 [Streptomyces smyrnaeus]|uniref:hypothetical protein n=1 Tax=Streptomyces smyrnaeus TaxID=1387713 RepID=UPI003686AB14
MGQPRRRGYGSDHDDAHPYARPGCSYRELVGGLLDGLCSTPPDAVTKSWPTGAALITEIGQFGPGGRALYRPRPTNSQKWNWEGDTP